MISLLVVFKSAVKVLRKKLAALPPCWYSALNININLKKKMKKVVYTYKTLGDSIALLCNVSDITIQELCTNCEISKRTYYQVIAGETLV